MSSYHSSGVLGRRMLLTLPILESFDLCEVFSEVDTSLRALKFLANMIALRPYVFILHHRIVLCLSSTDISFGQWYLFPLTLRLWSLLIWMWILVRLNTLLLDNRLILDRYSFFLFGILVFTENDRLVFPLHLGHECL